MTTSPADDPAAFLQPLRRRLLLLLGVATMPEAVRALQVPHASSAASEHVTVSIGAASARAVDETGWVQLLLQADQALFAAKSRGRNQLVLAEPGDEQRLSYVA